MSQIFNLMRGHDKRPLSDIMLAHRVLYNRSTDIIPCLKLTSYITRTLYV